MAMQQCPRCGSGASEEAMECKICGQQLAGKPAAAAAAAPQPVAATAAAAATPPSQPSELDGFVIPGDDPGSAEEPSFMRPTGAASSTAPAAPAPMPAAPPTVSQPSPLNTGLAGGQAAPPPNYLSGSQAAGMGGGGDVRVSLTGEVMEIPQPTPRGKGPGGYGPSPAGGPGGPPGARPGAPGGVPRARGAGIAYDEEPTKKSPVGPILLVILLIIGGVGGWWWYNNRTNPKDQALAFYSAFLKDQDYKAAYPVMALSDDQKKKYPDAESFSKGADEIVSDNPLAKAGMAMLKNALSDITVGEPVITGAKADVPTSAKLTIMGKSVTMKGTAHMIKEGGVWKFDGTQGGQQVAKSLQELVGKPDASTAGG